MVNRRLPALPKTDQILLMRKYWPDFALRKTSRLSWTGKLRPTVLSEMYTIEVVLRSRSRPEVWVRQPDLKVARADYKVQTEPSLLPLFRGRQNGLSTTRCG
jgi:hypothetical protein